MTIFLDTHAWIWWVSKDKRLSRRAAAALRSVKAGEGVWLSAISLWEVAKKVEKKQLVLDRPLRLWIHDALSVEGLYVAELTHEILLQSCELPQPFHGDPADLMIVATVRRDAGSLLTADKKIQDYPHVQTIW